MLCMDKCCQSDIGSGVVYVRECDEIKPDGKNAGTFTPLYTRYDIVHSYKDCHAHCD